MSDVLRMARAAGFEGVELMVTRREDTQVPGLVLRASEEHEVRIESVHAPFLMGAKRVWGDYRGKVERSVEMARLAGAGVVVIHLPYFWELGFARWMRQGMGSPARDDTVVVAVENAIMLKAHRPLNFSRFNSLPQLKRLPHLVFDTSHFAIAGVDIFHAWEELRDKVRHIHLSNNYLLGYDDHALPFQGRLPLDRFLAQVKRDGYGGKVALELGPGPLEARLGEKRVVDNLKRSLDYCRAAVY